MCVCVTGSEMVLAINYWGMFNLSIFPSRKSCMKNTFARASAITTWTCKDRWRRTRRLSIPALTCHRTKWKLCKGFTPAATSLWPNLYEVFGCKSVMSTWYACRNPSKFWCFGYCKAIYLLGHVTSLEGLKPHYLQIRMVYSYGKWAFVTDHFSVVSIYIHVFCASDRLKGVQSDDHFIFINLLTIYNFPLRENLYCVTAYSTVSHESLCMI